jgi:hypothetical protein
MEIDVPASSLKVKGSGKASAKTATSRSHGSTLKTAAKKKAAKK